MQHHKSVETVVVTSYFRRDLLPVCRRYVAGVDGGIELYVFDIVIEHLDLWHVVDQVIEVERAERVCLRVLYHADGATGVYDEDTRTGGVVLLLHGGRCVTVLFNLCAGCHSTCGAYDHE